MKVPYVWSLFLIAALASFVHKLSDPQFIRSGGSLLTNITEEESYNIVLMVFLIPAGWMIKLLVVFCLSVWALIQACIVAE